MDSYLVKTCDHCGSVFDAISRIDKVLSKYAKNKYQNDAYLLSKIFPKQKIKRLVRYKNILEDCTWSGDFYNPYYSVETIISRVKILTNGL